jgi:hypothetical protein
MTTSRKIVLLIVIFSFLAIPLPVNAQGNRDEVEPPEPYVEGSGERLLENTNPAGNLVGKPDIVLPQRAVAKGLDNETLPGFEPNAGEFGYFLYNATGIYVNNTPGTNINVPLGDTFYAPTNYPAGGSTVEAVTASWRYEGTVTNHAFCVWDWAGYNSSGVYDGSVGWDMCEFMDQAWQSKYVRKKNGLPYYSLQVYKDSAGKWVAQIYNFNLQRWEVKSRIGGTSTTGFGNTGWTMWERHSNASPVTCPTIPQVRASNIRVKVNGSWVGLFSNTLYSSTLGPTGPCWDSGIYKGITVRSSNTWYTKTPN